MNLNEILEKNISLVFLDSDIKKEGLPDGMVVSCTSDVYFVYFQVNGKDDFDLAGSYEVKDYAKSKEFEDVLIGAYRLAEAINNGEIDI